MKKSLTGKQIADERRKNSILLGLIFALIMVAMLVSFGANIFYVIAIFALPLLLVRGFEEVDRAMSSQKPQRISKRK